MKTRVRLLSLSVWITSVLLCAAGLLVVVGVFNATLGWDIFGPKVEAFLYGIFGSCMALAGVGVALTLVLGIHEVVSSVRGISEGRDEEARRKSEAPRKAYLESMMFIALLLAAVIAVLAMLNAGIQRHRSKVFKKLASEQMEHFGAKIRKLVGPLERPPRDHVPQEIYDMMNTLDDLSFVQRATLYIPDPEDKSAMWGYTAWREYRIEDGFARFFIAKDFERAMQSAVGGEGDALVKQNGAIGFTWYYPVATDDGVIAIMRLDGNPRENFREYPLGS
ncbi:MAG: hypothetical protein KJ626_05455 [Verrucomicrobia bacterium]|nr:hypothetical protein [Verrucomicrobiota bacterium]